MGKKALSMLGLQSKKRLAARRPAAVPQTYRFNHVVRIDLKLATTLRKEWWLNGFCWGTGYQQLWRLGNDDSKKKPPMFGTPSLNVGRAFSVNQRSSEWILDWNSQATSAKERNRKASVSFRQTLDLLARMAAPNVPEANGRDNSRLLFVRTHL